jgi:hypothetical protein
MYTISSVVLNHSAFIRSFYGSEWVRWTIAEEIEYNVEFPDNASADSIADRIMADLDLPGSRFVRGPLSQGEYLITRQDPFDTRRVTFRPSDSTLVIEQRNFNIPTFLIGTHIRLGYGQTHMPSDLWAFMVDLVAVSMLIWVITGIYMWWKIPRIRTSGGASALTGFAIFILLLVSI